MQSFAKQSLAGTFAAAGAIAMASGGAPFALAAGIGAAFFLAAQFLIPTSNQPKVTNLDLSISQDEVNELVNGAIERVKAIRTIACSIKKRAFAEKIQAVSKEVDAICEVFIKDHRTIRDAGPLHDTLDMIARALGKYASFAQGTVMTRDILESMDKTEQMVDTVIHALRRQRGRLLEGDRRSMDIEVNTINALLSEEAKAYQEENGVFHHEPATESSGPPKLPEV